MRSLCQCDLKGLWAMAESIAGRGMSKVVADLERHLELHVMAKVEKAEARSKLRRLAGEG